MEKILIVDDEKNIRNSLRDILEFEKYIVDEAIDGVDALNKLKGNQYDVVLCDIKMPKKDGLEVLQESFEFSEAPFIVISGHGDIETAVEAVKKGAFDYLAKPLDLHRLLITVRNALDKRSLVTETKTLKRRVSGKYKMVGESEELQKILNLIDKVADTDARVLITGENGTGKELVARQIHEKSKRKKKPFVEVNCAAIPSELIESELFGHEKGSFTGAVKQRKGDFEQANGGTLFLDEIGDMSLSAQAKVLRALQENKITRIGGEKEINVDVRIIAATNKNIKEEIVNNRFREDLYHRLSVILIDVPKLSERSEDIPILAEHFINILQKSMGKKLPRFEEAALEEMKKLPWTGNIRELKNVVERLTILCEDVIKKEDIKRLVHPM